MPALSAPVTGAAEVTVARAAQPVLLAVDGNSLLHRAFHAMATGDTRDAAGRGVWAIKGLLSLVGQASARLTPDAIVIGFDCPRDSVRRNVFPQYKAHRVAKPADLCEQLDRAPRLLAEAGFCVVTAAGQEADDVLASAAALAGREGFRCTLMTSDRDAFALVSDTTCVLRVLNGGIDGSPVLTPDRVPLVCGVTPAQYRDFAALRGDASDNLRGVDGIGPKTAAALLTRFGTLDAAYAALDGGDEAAVVAAIGPSAAAKLGTGAARAAVELNRRLMAMRDDLDLPPIEAMRLPLDPVRLQSALRTAQIHLGPSLWALAGGSPPEWLAQRQGMWSGPEGDVPDQEWGDDAGTGRGGDRDPLAQVHADRVLRSGGRPAGPVRASKFSPGDGQLSLF